MAALCSAPLQSRGSAAAVCGTIMHTYRRQRIQLSIPNFPNATWLQPRPQKQEPILRGTTNDPFRITEVQATAPFCAAAWRPSQRVRTGTSSTRPRSAIVQQLQAIGEAGAGCLRDSHDARSRSLAATAGRFARERDRRTRQCMLSCKPPYAANVLPRALRNQRLGEAPAAPPAPRSQPRLPRGITQRTDRPEQLLAAVHELVCCCTTRISVWSNFTGSASWESSVWELHGGRGEPRAQRRHRPGVCADCGTLGGSTRTPHGAVCSERRSRAQKCNLDLAQRKLRKSPTTKPERG